MDSTSRRLCARPQTPRLVIQQLSRHIIGAKIVTTLFTPSFVCMVPRVDRVQFVKKLFETERNNAIHALVDMVDDSFTARIVDEGTNFARVFKRGKLAFLDYLEYLRWSYSVVKTQLTVIGGQGDEVIAALEETRVYQNLTKSSGEYRQKFVLSQGKKLLHLESFPVKLEKVPDTDEDSYYSSYSYSYSESEESTKKDPVKIVEKFMKVFISNSMDGLHQLTEIVAKRVSVNVWGSPDPSFNGHYHSEDEFWQYMNKVKTRYKETDTKYKLSKIANEKGWVFVRATITSVRTYVNGSRYDVSEQLTFSIGRNDKIQRVNSHSSFTRLETQHNKGEYIDCVQSCTSSGNKTLPSGWGKNKGAELAAIKNSYPVTNYVNCICKNCANYVEVATWPSREEACAIAAGPSVATSHCRVRFLVDRAGWITWFRASFLGPFNL